MKKETLFFLFILILSIFLRVTNLDDIPLRVDGDSSRFALDGQRAWQEHWSLFSTGWYGHANGYFYLVGWFLKIFKNDLLGIRMFSSLGGTLAILAVYLLAKEVFDEKNALWSSLFLGVCPFHLVFSRVGMEVVWTTFFAPLGIFLLLKRKPVFSFLSGALVGLAQYFCPAMRLIPILTVATMTILWMKKQLNFKKMLTFLFVWSIGFFIIYSPMINYYLLHPEAYWARVNIISIFQSGWFENELKTSNLQAILIKQIINSFSAFHLPVKADLAWFYRTPFLDPLIIALFTLGLIVGLWQIKNWPFQFLFFYLLSGIFLGGMITIGSPTPSRYIILFPAVACFVGVGLIKLIDFFSSKKLAVSFLSGVIITTSLYSYWAHETKDVWDYDLNTQIATFAGRYLGKVSQDYDIYFVGNDYLYYEAIPTLHFLTDKKGEDIFEPIEEKLKKINFNKKTFFIIIDSRENELAKLQGEFPSGKMISFSNPKGQFLFWLFEVSPRLFKN